MANILTRHGDLLKEGERMSSAIAANEADLPHLQLPGEKMEAMMEEMRELIIRQGVLTGEKQTVSSRIQDLFSNGSRLLTFLRKGVQDVYGIRAEKLAEFGVTPFRGRTRRTPEPEPLPTPPPPVIEYSSAGGGTSHPPPFSALPARLLPPQKDLPVASRTFFCFRRIFRWFPGFPFALQESSGGLQNFLLLRKSLPVASRTSFCFGRVFRRLPELPFASEESSGGFQSFLLPRRIFRWLPELPFAPAESSRGFKTSFCFGRISLLGDEIGRYAPSPQRAVCYADSMSVRGKSPPTKRRECPASLAVA